MKTRLLPLLISLFIVSCSPPEEQKAISKNPNDPSDSSDQKPQSETPPLATETQLKVGSQIVWKYQKNGCFRWTIIGNSNHKISVKENFSADCNAWWDFPYRLIDWNALDGEIIRDHIKDEDGTTTVNDNFTHILPMIVMGVEKLDHKFAEISLNGNKKFKAFYLIKNPKVWYAVSDDLINAVVVKSINSTKPDKSFTLLKYSPVN